METWARIGRLKDEVVSIMNMIRDSAHAVFEFALAVETREVSACEVGKSLASVPLHGASGPLHWIERTKSSKDL